MRLKFQMPGINTKDVFAVHGGKVITFVPDALMNGVGPSHEVQIFGRGKLVRTSLVLHNTRVPRANGLTGRMLVVIMGHFF